MVVHNSLVPLLGVLQALVAIFQRLPKLHIIPDYGARERGRLGDCLEKSSASAGTSPVISRVALSDLHYIALRLAEWRASLCHSTES